jgi:hypothetical protein
MTACVFSRAPYRTPLRMFIAAFRKPPLILKSIISPAHGIILRITGGFLNTAISILKRVTGKIFTISKCFHRSKPKLYLLISP